MRFDRLDQTGFLFFVVIDAAAVFFFQKGERSAVRRQDGMMVEELLQINVQEFRDLDDFLVRNPNCAFPLAAGAAAAALKTGEIHGK